MNTYKYTLATIVMFSSGKNIKIQVLYKILKYLNYSLFTDLLRFICFTVIVKIKFLGILEN